MKYEIICSGCGHEESIELQDITHKASHFAEITKIVGLCDICIKH